MTSKPTWRIQITDPDSEMGLPDNITVVAESIQIALGMGEAWMKEHYHRKTNAYVSKIDRSSMVILA